jgi:hypothetical protein
MAGSIVGGIGKGKTADGGNLNPQKPDPKNWGDTSRYTPSQGSYNPNVQNSWGSPYNANGTNSYNWNLQNLPGVNLPKNHYK